MLIQRGARCAGFTEEFIDEMKETLAGSNLHMLLLTALVTAVQVSHISLHTGKIIFYNPLIHWIMCLPKVFLKQFEQLIYVHNETKNKSLAPS